MAAVNIHEAKTHRSRLLVPVSEGEEVVAIAKAGKPIARLSALEGGVGVRTPGRDARLFSVPEDSDAPLPQESLADFDRREKLLGCEFCWMLTFGSG